VEYETIILEKEGAIATLTLNRPDRLNAISPPMRNDLRDALKEVREDDDIRVLIVTGAGRGFCAGADVEALLGARAAGELKRSSRNTIHEPLGPYVIQLKKLEKPTICALNGVAVGVGLSLALACDIRIASENASLRPMWVKTAITPDAGATHALPRIMGTAKALELLFTGEAVNAQEAERLGLVNRVMPADELMNAAKELAGKIAKGPPIAIELIKRAVYRGIESDFDSQTYYESYVGKISELTEEYLSLRKTTTRGFRLLRRKETQYSRDFNTS
jgi:2-(1,2-epoxy-1,2-dihydrophenyl)acetyl-CoA isomerase